MKLSTLLVAGSLALNAALLAVYVSRPHSASSASAQKLPAASTSSGNSAANAGPSKAAAESAKAAPGAAPAKETWTQLNTGDLHALAARLRAAGFPPAVVRSVISTQINESFKSRREQLMPANQDKPFWETNSGGIFAPIGYDAKYYAGLRDLGREQSKLLKEILGDDASPGDSPVSDYQRRRFGDLPPDKIEQLQRLDQDYNDLRNEIQISSRGIILPEDREKMAVLEKEKRADLAKLLSPQEMEEYLTRTSNTTNRLRTALTTMNATDAEFRAIYQAQSAFDEKYNGGGLFGYSGPEAMKDRQADQAKVSEQIKAALGEPRYAEYARASDREFQQLNRMATQASLPEYAALQAYNAREKALKESSRIFDDASLPPEQKRAALQALGQTARAEITEVLGADVGARYLQVANRWLSGLERGAAVTFTENSLSIRNVPGPRPAPNPGANPSAANPGPTVAPARPIATP